MSAPGRPRRHPAARSAGFVAEIQAFRWSRAVAGRSVVTRSVRLHRTEECVAMNLLRRDRCTLACAVTAVNQEVTPNG